MLGHRRVAAVLLRRHSPGSRPDEKPSSTVSAMLDSRAPCDIHKNRGRRGPLLMLNISSSPPDRTSSLRVFKISHSVAKGEDHVNTNQNGGFHDGTDKIGKKSSGRYDLEVIIQI